MTVNFFTVTKTKKWNISKKKIHVFKITTKLLSNNNETPSVSLCSRIADSEKVLNFSKNTTTLLTIFPE